MFRAELLCLGVRLNSGNLWTWSVTNRMPYLGITSISDQASKYGHLKVLL